MPEFSVGSILFLIVLFISLFLLLSRKLDLDGCSAVPLAFVLTFFVFIVFHFLDPVKRIQCLVTPPNYVWIAGHIRDDSNPQPNDYLVILFKGKQEIDKDVTRHGSFAVDKKDEPGHGYFELAAPNEFGLTRCLMVENFEQTGAGRDVWGLDIETAYLWHNFADLEAGKYPLNNGEPEHVYTLVVLPGDKDHFPIEMSLYPTYLDEKGEVAINAPIKKYRVLDQPEADPTGYYVYSNPLLALALGISTSTGTEVGDAWVKDSAIGTIIVGRIPDGELIDIDNCQGILPVKKVVPRSFIYFHEVQFPGNANWNFDLGAAAFKAYRSLGFMHGQMGTVVAEVPVDVPAGTHKKYKVIWRELWKTGTMVIDFGEGNTEVTFRARIGMDWDHEEFPVDCP